MHPLLVLLSGDVGIAIQRAIRERGEPWARKLAAREFDVEEPERLPGYFERLRALSLEVLRGWPFERLDLDTTAAACASCEAVLADRLAR